MSSKSSRFPIPWMVLLFLFLAPLWAFFLEKVTGHNLFVEEDAMILLSLSSLFVFLSVWLIPKGVVSLIEKVTTFVSQQKVISLSIGILALFGLFIGQGILNKEVLHSFMNSADEHSCLFLAECLRVGKLFVEPHALSEFFDVVHVGNRDGKWFSVYPLGWPILMAIGLELQILDWINPALVTLSLVFFYLAGKRFFGREASILGLTLIALTPFFTFTGASYYSHGSCLFLISVFLYTFMKWMDSEKESQRILWASLCATAIGYGLMTRYLTMAATAFPFLVYHYTPLLLRKRPWRRSDQIACGIMVLFVLATLWHNYLVTGKPTRAPNKHDKSWERLGFRDFYTPLDGLRHIVARFFYLMDWMSPFLVALFATVLFQKKKLEPFAKIAYFAFFCNVIAYFFYFSWGGNQYGPRYYYEGIPFLGLVLGDSLYRWWKSGEVYYQKFVIATILVVSVAIVHQFPKQIEEFEAVSRQRKELYVYAEEKVQRPAIVFIKGFLGQQLVMAQEDAVRNHPLLQDDLLYAHDLGEKNSQLKQYFPDYSYYRGRYDRTELKPILEKLDF